MYLAKGCLYDEVSLNSRFPPSQRPLGMVSRRKALLVTSVAKERLMSRQKY